LEKNIIFIYDSSDLEVIPKTLLMDESLKKFTFSLDAHQSLELKKINHITADNLLEQNERLELFDKALDFLLLNFKVASDDLEFEGVNLLELFDVHEFLSYFVPTLVEFITIKRIIAKENPSKIICSDYFKKMIESIIKTDNIKITFYKNQIRKKLFWDDIHLKYNLFKIPIRFTLSKTNYLKIKKFMEIFMGFSENIWLDLNDSTKKSILLLEFNPELWTDLLNNLKNYDGNIILVNRRRSAIWSKKSLNVIKKSNIKVLNFNNILTKSEEQKIPILVNDYIKKMIIFSKNSKIFSNSFLVENCDFWYVVEEYILKSFSEKFTEFIFLVLTVKKLYRNLDIKCIVSLHELGETEKAFLEYNHNKIQSLVLDHGFVERIKETNRFDKLLYVNFKDSLALWGNIRKEYLLKEYNISPEKIIVTGSSRHDIYFNSRIKKEKSDQITILLAPNPIGNFSGLANTNLELKFENTLKKIIKILKDFDVKIIVKLHQIQLKHNQDILEMIKKIDKKIPIHISSSVIEIINKSDVVLVISSESFGTSTMLMESMILGKPTMNIVLDEKIPQYTHVKDNAVLTISSSDELKQNLEKILFDKDFQNQLIQNADRFIEKFLQNRGNASEKCASILKSF